MRKNRFIMIFLFIAVGAMGLFIQPVMAARTVNLDVNPSTSTPGGISPDIDGVNAVYSYIIYDGQSVTDTIPVQVCMTGSASGWISLDVTFGNTNGNLSGVTLPPDQTFYATATLPDCRNLSIQISTGQLSEGNYNTNFNVADLNPVPSGTSNKPQASWADIKNFHISVTVLKATNNVSCFLTDSDGMFLTNCAGTMVSKSGSDEGRFTIVANKKNIQVSTNPGQFYFNLVWLNKTGSQQIVNVNFDRTSGVVPHGAQAIHSAVFNGYLTTVNPPVFDEANFNGIPDGTDDQALGIVVPAGSSLLVTYHLTWADKGNPIPVGGINEICEQANQLIEVIGEVSGTGITPETCKSSALGYKK